MTNLLLVSLLLGRSVTSVGFNGQINFSLTFSLGTLQPGKSIKICSIIGCDNMSKTNKKVYNRLYKHIRDFYIE